MGYWSVHPGRPDDPVPAYDATHDWLGPWAVHDEARRKRVCERCGGRVIERRRRDGRVLSLESDPAQPIALVCPRARPVQLLLFQEV